MVYKALALCSELKKAAMNSNGLQLVIFVSALLLRAAVEGHVRLTFPPSRLSLYDFLDNARTQGPCGTPGKCFHLWFEK